MVSGRLFKDAGWPASICLHLISIAIVIYFAWPILNLYWNQKPAVGIDLFLSVDFVTYLRDNLSLPFNSWKYIWYGGTPLAQSYPLLHFYLIQPLLKWLSAVQAVQVYVIASYALFLIFSYFLFFSISKSRAFAAFLSIATAYSFNLWSPLYWSGSIPYAATMFLLPLSLYLVHAGYEHGNKKYLYMSALLSGLFILGHPQSFIGYTVPITTILILFFSSKRVKFFQADKIYTLIFYGLIVFFVSFPLAGVGLGVFLEFFKLIGSAFSQGAGEIAQSSYAEYAKETAGSPVLRMLDIYTRTNPIFFWAMGLLLPVAVATTLLAVAVKRKASHSLRLILPFLLSFVYIIVFIYAFVLGINPLSGGWFRVFWPCMVVFGAIASVLWRVSTDNLEIIFEKIIGKSIVFKVYATGLGCVLGLVVLLVGVPFLETTYKNFQKETLSFVSESSAFPTAISLNISRGEWPEKLPKLVPDWLNPNDRSYRLYNMDATFNIWWNSVFKMPLARGYIDSSPKNESAENYAGWQYLQNIVFSKNEAVERWGYSEEQAKAMAAFLIDWHGIKFWEGAPVYGRNYASAPSTYISDDKNFIKHVDSVFTLRPAKYFQIEGRGWDIPDTQQELKYYEIKDEITSPIYTASNAPTILVVGDYVGQDTSMRNFGLLNFNSRRAIILQWNRPIDSLSDKELKNFDVVILYRYKYKNAKKAFMRLESYVKSGGNLFLDSGTEQKESEGDNLPPVFPFESAERKPLGSTWQWELGESSLVEDVNFNNFSEPIFDEEDWSFSYPKGGLRGGSKVIARNHGKPVLIEQNLGEGKIIWSGMNFLGHLQRFKNAEETKLFANILNSFEDFSADKNIKVEFDRSSAEKVVIKGKDAKGVLFKEAGYPGWQARVNGKGANERVSIYEAGPMVPGYMYIFLPKELVGGNFEATFKYRGELIYKMTYLVSAVSILFILDLLFFKRMLNRGFGRVIKLGSRLLGKWWEKDE